jgi:hypothetical protein
VIAVDYRNDLLTFFSRKLAANELRRLFLKPLNFALEGGEIRADGFRERTDKRRGAHKVSLSRWSRL